MEPSQKKTTVNLCAHLLLEDSQLKCVRALNSAIGERKSKEVLKQIAQSTSILSFKNNKVREKQQLLLTVGQTLLVNITT